MTKDHVGGFNDFWIFCIENWGDFHWLVQSTNYSTEWFNAPITRFHPWWDNVTKFSWLLYWWHTPRKFNSSPLKNGASKEDDPASFCGSNGNKLQGFLLLNFGRVCCTTKVVVRSLRRFTTEPSAEKSVCFKPAPGGAWEFQALEDCWGWQGDKTYMYYCWDKNIHGFIMLVSDGLCVEHVQGCRFVPTIHVRKQSHRWYLYDLNIGETRVWLWFRAKSIPSLKLT